MPLNQICQVTSEWINIKCIEYDSQRVIFLWLSLFFDFKEQFIFMSFLSKYLKETKKKGNRDILLLVFRRCEYERWWKERWLAFRRCEKEWLSVFREITINCLKIFKKPLKCFIGQALFLVERSSQRLNKIFCIPLSNLLLNPIGRAVFFILICSGKFNKAGVYNVVEVGRCWWWMEINFVYSMVGNFWVYTTRTRKSTKRLILQVLSLDATYVVPLHLHITKV